MNMRVLIPALLALALADQAHAGQNVFPDPSFERTGNSTHGRNGGRCLTLAVKEKTRWRGKEYLLKVEPFARYRATGYARFQRTEGGASTLYGWTWNSFDWRFGAQAGVKPNAGWQQYTVRFVSPNEDYHFYPVVLHGSRRSEEHTSELHSP